LPKIRENAKVSSFKVFVIIFRLVEISL